MKLKKLTKSLLALAALTAFAACSQNDNPVKPDVPSTLNLASSLPTDNTDGIWDKSNPFASTWNVSFTLSFAEEVVVSNETPEGISLVNVYDGSYVEEKTFETTHWTVIPGEDAKSIVVKLVNEDGSLIGIKFGDEGYKLTVPAGVVSNVSGTASNEEIVVTFYTSVVAKEREGLPTALTLVSAQPSSTDEYGTIWEKANPFASTWNVEFVLTFKEKVVVKADKPEGITLVNTYNGKAIEEKSIEETVWVVKAGSDDNSVVVRLENTDFGNVIGAKLVDEAYRLTIPEGIVTNEAGTVPNGQISKTFYSSEAALQNNGRPTALTLVSVLPEDYDAENNLWTLPSPFASQWNIKFIVTFDEDVKIANDKPEGITLLQQGTNESIITVKNLTDFGGVHWAVETISDNSKAVLVRLVDDDFGGSKSAKLVDEAYKLTIPAGIITNLAGDVPNKEITGTFYSSEAAKQI